MPIEEIVSGKIISNSLGEFFVREEIFPIGYKHGLIDLNQPINDNHLTKASKVTNDEQKHNHMVFIDTETTGLAGGTGSGIVVDVTNHLLKYFEKRFSDVKINLYLKLPEVQVPKGMGGQFSGLLKGVSFYQANGYAALKELNGLASGEFEPYDINEKKLRIKTKNIINMMELDKAIELLAKSRRKYFFGLGNSGIAAMEAKTRLMRIGFHVDALQDSHFMAMTTSTLTSEDVIVLVSISGSTKDIIDVAEIARENGVKIIVITNYSKSPVARYADIILYTVRREGPLEGGSMVSKISQLYLIDVLCTGITLYINGDANEMLEKTARAVVNKIV